MEEHNMVKTVKYLISVALSIATVASCSFLEEESPARYSGKDIYGTEAALETAITGCYAQLRTSTGLTSTTMHEFLFPASGVVHFGGPKSRLSDGQLRWTMLLSFAQYSTSPQGYNLFKNFYATIQLCNRLIYELPSSPVEQHYKESLREIYLQRDISQETEYFVSYLNLEKEKQHRKYKKECYKEFNDEMKFRGINNLVVLK